MQFSLPQTSLIPTVIEITNFISQNWPHIWWFPHWYLGVPLRYITGPVVPLFVSLISKSTEQTLEVSYLILLLLGGFAGIVGMRMFVKEFGAGKRVQLVTSLLFLLSPFQLLLLTYGNGLHHLTIYLLPWVLTSFLRMLKHPTSRVYLVTTILLIATSLLIDTAGILSISIGMISLYVVVHGAKLVPKEILRYILICLVAVSIATVWYSPGYGLVLLGNPSYGGQPLSRVISWIAQLLQSLLPLVIAAWTIQKKVIIKNRLIQFSVVFGSVFVFLTLIRFLADIDFWMDWSSYFLELQLIGAVGGGVLFSRYLKKYIYILIVIFILTIIDGCILWQWYFDAHTVEFKKEVTTLLSSDISPASRFFLSGSPVFWSHVTQVRGGKDQVSIHPTWAMAAYQIRDGDQSVQAAAWLQALGVSHLLYHSPQSHEYFQDFRHPERFASWQKIADKKGDYIYQIVSKQIRLADNNLLDLDKPRDGKDQVIQEYAGLLGEDLPFNWQNPSQLIINSDRLDKTKVISIAVTHTRDWRLISQNGRLKRDALGNIAIAPSDGQSRWELVYQEGIGSWITGLLLIVIFRGLLWKLDALYQFVAPKFPSLHTNAENEEENY